MRWTRAAAAAALVIGSIGLAGPAAAAPPNDDYQNATVLSGPLPITVEQSTLDADASPDTEAAELNAACGEFASPATDASVWFTYTPSEAGTVRVDTDGTDYSVGVIAATGGPGNWTVQTCGGEAGYFWPADAGTTYTILVFDNQRDGLDPGGLLKMQLDMVPPPPTVAVTVDPRGTFNPRTGAARISGTWTCSYSGTSEVRYTGIFVSLRQRAGRVIIVGEGDQFSLPCNSGTQPWTVEVTGDGLFKGGTAEADVFADACVGGVENDCGFFPAQGQRATFNVKLSGSSGKKG